MRELFLLIWIRFSLPHFWCGRFWLSAAADFKTYEFVYGRPHFIFHFDMDKTYVAITLLPHRMKLKIVKNEKKKNNNNWIEGNGSGTDCSVIAC